jgi:phospholipid/cholesterol/gamma-HCH transport system substrate-binding protein
MINSDLSRRSRLTFGLIGAGILAGGAFLSYLGIQNGHPGSTYVEASFGRAGEGLDDQSAVKIRGINVGTVSAVRLDSHWRVRVRLRLDQGVKVPATATAAIQPLSVFGPKFVELDPGTGETTGPYLADGGTVARTQDPQELADIAKPADRLLGAVAPEDLAAILHTLDQGVSGRGQELSDTIDNAGRLLDLGSQNIAQLRHLIDNGGVLANSTSAHGDQLVALAQNLNALAGPIAGDPSQVGALLDGGTQSAQMINALLLSAPGAVGKILDRAFPTVDTLDSNRKYIPLLISAVGADFKEVADIIRVPGPHNTLMTRTSSEVKVNEALCQTFLGLCGPAAPALPLPKKGQ